MRIKNQKDKQGRIVHLRNYILGAVCAVLAVFSVLLTIDGATSGVEIANLEEKQKELALEKKGLEEQLVKNLSASNLQEKSTELGFIKPATLVYVSQLPPVAKLP